MGREYEITDPEEMKVTEVGPAPHPGGYLRNLLKVDYGLTVKEAARLLGVDRAGLTQTMNGKYAVSADLALKVEALTGFDPLFLLGMQARHDVDSASMKRAEYARTIPRQELAGVDLERLRAAAHEIVHLSEQAA